MKEQQKKQKQKLRKEEINKDLYIGTKSRKKVAKRCGRKTEGENMNESNK